MKRTARLWLSASVCAVLLCVLLAAAVVAQDAVIHVVQPGDTIAKLALRYGVGVREIVAANRLAAPNLIYAGQRLVIPVSGTAGTQPAVQAPATDACACEALVILSPSQGMTVTSPFTVTGLVIGSAPTTALSLVAAVLDGSAREIGRAYGFANIDGRARSAFAIPLTFTAPLNSQPGRIQIWSISPLDGAVEHLNSVVVRVQGLELDRLLSQLVVAAAAKDAAALEPFMADPFRLVVQGARSPELPLPQAAAIQRLAESGLNAGAPRLDFSVDARALLGARMILGPDVMHVIYSTGWGPVGRDDAFLLIGEEEGRAQLTGMVYVPAAMIDYR